LTNTGYPHDDYFKEYRKLGGTKDRVHYDKMVDVFVFHTNDIYIHGDTTKYKSRDEALDACQKELQISNNELGRLFNSIDNVTSYT
tara:strand:+ start:123 stop:380 length:258 start_codon:yes stop_codon:yes gene_type:complete